jgi:lipopolysaccharide export LptBFGC system permease protein LptF
MPTLTRYIVRHFVTNFAILLAVLLLLFVLIDFVIDMDEFFQAGERIAQRRALAEAGLSDRVSLVVLDDLLGREQVARRAMEEHGLASAEAEALAAAMEVSFVARTATTVWVIADYYLPLMLLIYTFFSGLVVLAAMGFTLAALSRQRELTAMVASGISLYRVALPLIVTGAVLSALALPVQELVIPRLSDKLARGKSELKDLRPKAERIDMASDGQGVLLSAADFDPTTDPPQLTGVQIVDRGPERLLRREIKAEQALWVASEGAWELLGDRTLTRTDGEGPMGQPPPPTASLLYPTSLTPTVLRIRQATAYPFFLPITRLQAIAADPAVGAVQAQRLLRIVWSRFSLVVLNVLVLVIGLPFFLMRGPMNPLLQSMKCAGVCQGAWGGGVVALQGGGELLNPMAGAWLPVVVLLPVAAGLLASVKT